MGSWDVVVDVKGEVTAAWIEGDEQPGLEYAVWASRLSAGGGWTRPVRIGGPLCCGLGNLRLEVGLQGHVAAVFGGGFDGFWMNSFRPDLGWGQAERIWAGTPFSFVVDGAGRVVFAWSDEAFSETLVHQRTWTYDFDANAWLDTESASDWPERDDYVVAYDVESGRAILFGFTTSCCLPWSEAEQRGETWAYDPGGNAWTNMSPNDAPTHVGASGVSPRTSYAMAYDAESDRVILLGGWFHEWETWVYDYNSNTWTNMAPDTSPPFTWQPTVVYDAGADRIITLAGLGREATWAYDFNTNTWADMDAERVWSGNGGPLIYDSESDRVVYLDDFGLAQTYDYGTNSWVRVGFKGITPPGPNVSPRSSVYDEGSDRILAFFQGDYAFSPYSDGETWAYDLNSNTWTQVAWQDASPSDRVIHRGPPFYDPRLDRVFYFETEEETIRYRNTWANHFTPGIGWDRSVEGPLSSSSFPSGSWGVPPAIGITQAGNVLTFVGEEGGIAAVQYTPGFGWRTVDFLDTEVLRQVWSAFSPFGNALVLWEEQNRTRAVVKARSFVPGVGWTAQSPDAALSCPLSGSRSDAHECPGISQLAVSRTGHALALGQVGSSLVAEDRSAVLGSFAYGSWSPWIPLDSIDDLEGVEIAVDDLGRGLMVWGADGEIAASQFLPGAGLLEPFRVGSAHDRPRLAMHPSGDAVLVWGEREEGIDQLLARQFSAVDVEPPLLTLTSPQDGLQTSEATVTVTGMTEAEARLVVNGIDVTVEKDGSFSVPVGLSVGTNTITATATDQAQNRATVSLQVEYVNPIPDLEQRLRDAITALGGSKALVVLLVGLQGIFVAAIAVLFFLYWNQRRPPPGARRGTQGVGMGIARLFGRGGAPPQALHSDGNPGKANPLKGVENPWPATPRDSPLRLTIKERVALHLLDHARDANNSEVPQDLTQVGIASAAAFERRHFTEYVRPLMEEGLVEERSTHVEGALQRRKAYLLTGPGRHRALAIRKRMGEAVVQVRDSAGVREATFAEAVAEAPRSLEILGMVREAIEAGTVDIRPRSH